MNEDKPQKRLVGWKQYAGNIAARVLGRSVAFVFFIGGLVCFGFSILTFMLWFSNSNLNAGNIGYDPRYLGLGSLLAGLFMLGLWFSIVVSRRVEKIEPVGLITRHNTGNLPEAETLVRASDSSDTAQRAELLRAGRYSQETPSEQLLRATQENRQDV